MLSSIGSYKISRLIGKGKNSEIYEGIHPTLNHKVAIKVLPSTFTCPPKTIKRFKREAQALASLKHPNIVRIYDFGQENSMLYYIMELLEGNTLEYKIYNSDLSIKQNLDIIKQISKGLKAAHKQKIIHRDIKPSNIIFTKQGIPKITDFGLAKIIDYESLTCTGELYGTPSYMSPEQTSLVSDNTINEQSDLFSLGAVFYEMLSRKRAFCNEHIMQTLKAVAFESPKNCSSLNHNVDKKLNSIIFKLIEKNKSNRYQNIDEFILDLNQYLCGGIIKAKHTNKITSLLCNMKLKLPLTNIILIIITCYVSFYYISQNKKNTLIKTSSKQILKNDISMKSNTKNEIADINVLLNDFQKKTIQNPVFLNNRTNTNSPSDKKDKNKKTKDYMEIMNLLHEKVNCFIKEKKFNEAIHYLKSIIEIQIKKDGKQTTIISTLYSKLAFLYETLNKFKSASKYYYLSLEIDTLQPDNNHNEITNKISKLSYLYYKYDDHIEAINSYNNLLKNFAPYLKLNNEQTADIFNSLAFIHFKLKQNAKAELYFQKSLDIYDKTKHSDKLKIAAIYNNLGMLHKNNGDYIKAQSFYKKSLKIKKQNLGENHPKIITTLRNLALLNYYQKSFDQAELQFKKIIIIIENNPERDQTNIIKTLNYLAILYQSQNKYDEAIFQYKKAISIFEKSKYKNNPEFLITLQNLKNIFLKQKKIKEVKSIQKQINQIRNNKI